MKRWIPAFFPGVLLVGAIIGLRYCLKAAPWMAHPSIEHLAYALFGLSALMGAVFAQSKAVFIAAYLVVATYLARQTLTQPASEADQMLWLTLSVATPVVLTVLCRLRERGLFSVRGVQRIAMMSLVIAAVIFASRYEPLYARIHASAHTLFRPLSRHVPIPILGVIITCLAIPAMVVRVRRESPLLGVLISWVLVFQALSLASTSTIWPACSSLTANIVFGTAAAITLALTVMESAWRHAHLDELTALPNRRAFSNHLSALGTNYAIAMIDIDHFKKVNDRYGHDNGDQVLRFVAAQIARSRLGTAYRYGGEEFAVISEGHELKAVETAMDELRGRIAERRFHVRGKGRPKKATGTRTGKKETGRWGHTIPVTVSVGLAQRTEKRSTPQQVIKSADQALYRAKKNGRNQVCVTRG